MINCSAGLSEKLLSAMFTLPLNFKTTLVYLIAEQAVISKQDGILQKKVKRAGYNKRAGWNILLSKISEQVEFHSKEPSLMHCRVRKP